MAVSVTYASTITIAETLDENTGSAAAASRLVTHSEFNEAGTYNGSSTPPCTKTANFIATLSSGALTLDFTSLTGTNGATINGTGLKVQMLRCKNLGANNLTITPGASNGIDMFGASGSVTVFPNAHVTFFFNDASPDIASGDRTLDLVGTGSQTSEWTVVMG